MPSIPVSIVTGFLGSGKTTLIQRLLATSTSTIAVIVNEFGELGIDGLLLADATGPVIELANGCMCCESRGDLARALTALARHADSIDAIIVETSGVSDPLGVADVLTNHLFPMDLTLSAVITVVDADNFDRNLDHAEAAFLQLVSADAFVISKTDLTPRGTTELLRDRIARVNSRAPVINANQALDLIEMLSPIAAAESVLAEQRSHRAEAGFSRASWSGPIAWDEEEFTRWAEALPARALRLKAVAWLSGECRVIHRVGVRTTVLPAPDAVRVSLDPGHARVVLVGPAGDGSDLSTQLDILRQEAKDIHL